MRWRSRSARDAIERAATNRSRRWKTIKEAARANTVDNFKLVFDKELEGLFVDRMEGNDGIFRRVMQDENLRGAAAVYLLNRVYQQARSEK